ncbi:MAG: hypothetical protein K2K31_00530 [Clostridia bacterium]|nr:hypothetical protein [Clostridia bacterium]
MSEENENTKKYSLVQIVMMVLIVLLTVAIIVQIIILADYKSKIDQYKEENEKLEQLLPETKQDGVMQTYLDVIENRE